MNPALNFVMLARFYRPRNPERDVATNSTVLYGISNCDTVRKARKWLHDNGIDHRFHDFRADGLDPSQVADWVRSLGWETLLNRRSTTWQQLAANLRDNIDAQTAVAAMADHPTLIKRPVLEFADGIQVGFKPDQYRQLFGAA